MRLIRVEISRAAQTLADAVYEELPHMRRRAMPGFPDLARRIVEVWAPQPGLEGEISRLLRDMGRFMAGTWAIYLEATPGGLTVARLSETLQGTTISGPGRARAILAYMRFIGYVEPAPEEGDGRDRRYRTTDTMRRAFRERLRRELTARADQDPAIVAVLDDFEARFIDYFVITAEVSVGTLQNPQKQSDELDIFSERFAGMAILCEMMLTAEPGDSFPPRGPLNFTVAEIARRCDTSRMQVNSLLKKARAAGVLLPTGDGRERLSEVLLNLFETLVAGTTDIMVGCARILQHGSPTFYDEPPPADA